MFKGYSIKWPGERSHLRTEDLLLFLDGELSSRKATHVEKHIEACWSCRAHRESIIECIVQLSNYRDGILREMPESPPQAWNAFETKLGERALQKSREPIQKRTTLPHLGTGMACAASCLFLLLAWLCFSPAPVLSAQEVLQRAQSSETMKLSRSPRSAIYRELKVRRTSASSSSEFSTLVWDGRRQQGAPWSELEQVFRANHMADAPPLSASAFQAWRESTHRRMEQVSRTRLSDGSPAWIVRISVNGPLAPYSILEASLVVRTKDWHPVVLVLSVPGQSGPVRYELREFESQPLAENTPPSVVTANTLAPPFDRPLPHRSKPEPAAKPAAPPANLPELLDIEIQARFTLHRLGACLGEPIEVLSDLPGRILVRGLAGTQQRKEQLITALRGLPMVEVEIRTVDESLPRGISTAPHPSPPITVRASRLPIDDQLHQPEEEITAFVNEELRLADAAFMEAWALRRLADRYSPGKAQDLSRLSYWMLETMVREHTRSLRVSIGDARRLLEVMLPAASGGMDNIDGANELLAAPVWTQNYLLLFPIAKQVHSLVHDLWSGPSRPEGGSEAATHELQTALRRLEDGLRNLELRVGTEFSAGSTDLSSREPDQEMRK